MYPITIDVANADHSRRLEGFTSRSHRLQTAGTDAEDVDRPVRRHRGTFRPAFGR
jgi:hypothetical protein